MISRFYEENKFLSNFYPCKIYYKGIGFPTVEHAYQSSKTLNTDTIRWIASLRADQAGKAKRIGNNPKHTPLRLNWKEDHLLEMELLLKQKFSGKILINKLLMTGDKKLVEGNYHHDNYWGNCDCSKCKNIKGKNHLGELIMTIRSEL